MGKGSAGGKLPLHEIVLKMNRYRRYEFLGWQVLVGGFCVRIEELICAILKYDEQIDQSIARAFWIDSHLFFFDIRVLNGVV